MSNTTVEMVGDRGRLLSLVQRMVLFFYTCDILLTYTQLEWIQGLLDVLTEIFYQVCLNMNI